MSDTPWTHYSIKEGLSRFEVMGSKGPASKRITKLIEARDSQEACEKFSKAYDCYVVISCHEVVDWKPRYQ